MILKRRALLVSIVRRDAVQVFADQNVSKRKLKKDVQKLKKVRANDACRVIHVSCSAVQHVSYHVINAS